MNPILVNVWRGDTIESQHRGSAIVVNTSGDTLFEVGDTTSLVFPRSSLKLIQALPVLESGAADALGLQAEHIALICASHSGEDRHTMLVRAILQQLGLNPDNLACGAEYPDYQPAAHQLIKQGIAPGREHHNCSGKHSGMLCLCRHMHWDKEDYHLYDHPSQRAWRQVLSELLQLDANALPWDFDGCGVPALAMPLSGLAHAYAAFAANLAGEDSRNKAMQRILQSIAAHPLNIAGTDRACSRVIAASEGRVIVKTGAEGVFIGVIPDREIAFALKIDDGATRASETALGGVLGWLKEPVAEMPEMQAVFCRELRNSQGKVVGRVESVFQPHLL
ncbi:MAG: asparaginase [Thiolinea sp.]